MRTRTSRRAWSFEPTRVAVLEQRLVGQFALIRRSSHHAVEEDLENPSASGRRLHSYGQHLEVLALGPFEPFAVSASAVPGLGVSRS